MQSDPATAIRSDLAKNSLARFASTSAQIVKFGMTFLIIAGVVALLLAVLLIIPAAIAIKQAKAVSNGETVDAAGKPIGTSTATGIAIASAIVGSILLVGSVVGLVMGVASVGAIGVLLMGALLIVGAIASHRMLKNDSATQQPYENRGAWAHASAGLWIATVVLGLILPGIAAIILGAALGSVSSALPRAPTFAAANQSGVGLKA
jgi:hypothetical protein